MNQITLIHINENNRILGRYWDDANQDFGPKIPSRLIIEGGKRHRHIMKRRFNSFRLDPRTGARPVKALKDGCSPIIITSKFNTVALKQSDRIAVIKAAKDADKTKDIKFSSSLGSVYIDGSKYTDRHDATTKLGGKK